MGGKVIEISSQAEFRSHTGSSFAPPAIVDFTGMPLAFDKATSSKSKCEQILVSKHRNFVLALPSSFLVRTLQGNGAYLRGPEPSILASYISEGVWRSFGRFCGVEESDAHLLILFCRSTSTQTR